MKLQRVEVTWIDSAFHRGWSSAVTKQKEMDVSECRSIGYLISKDRRVIKLAMNQSDEGDSFADGISIPARAVKRIRILR